MGEKLWQRMEMFLSPTPSQADLYHALFMLGNIQGKSLGASLYRPGSLRTAANRSTHTAFLRSCA